MEASTFNFSSESIGGIQLGDKFGFDQQNPPEDPCRHLKGECMGLTLNQLLKPRIRVCTIWSRVMAKRGGFSRSVLSKDNGEKYALWFLPVGCTKYTGHGNDLAFPKILLCVRSDISSIGRFESLEEYEPSKFCSRICMMVGRKLKLGSYYSDVLYP